MAPGARKFAWGEIPETVEIWMFCGRAWGEFDGAWGENSDFVTHF
ncbi:hypothetical protein A2U01_0087079 [Trifolium medium]|uniref:Uncharacterized protein n=1 Tax=Trifolium medium TaxID=97028 RepID=A0A392TXD4_9FABA|nr:hypothetical protein [Trifolium medium]